MESDSETNSELDSIRGRFEGGFEGGFKIYCLQKIIIVKVGTVLMGSRLMLLRVALTNECSLHRDH